MRSYTVEGIVLKRTDIGEADRLITFFTKTHGKITLMAKGVRRPTSKRTGSLEQFNHLKLQVIPGRGELSTLAEVKVLNSHSSWRMHLGRVTLAYQAAEIVDKLTPDSEVHPEVFSLLEKLLTDIGRLGSDWQIQINQALIHLLQLLGYLDPAVIPSKNIYSLVEEVVDRPIYSHRLLSRLSSGVK